MTRASAVKKTAELLMIDVSRVHTIVNRTPYTGCELMLKVPYWLGPELIGRGRTWTEAYVDVETRKAAGLIEI